MLHNGLWAQYGGQQYTGTQQIFYHTVIGLKYMCLFKTHGPYMGLLLKEFDIKTMMDRQTER